MNGYEKIVTLMKSVQSGSSSFVLGEMQSQTVCSIGKLELEQEDYLINADIKDTLEKGDTVLVHKFTDEKYIILAKVV